MKEVTTCLLQNKILFWGSWLCHCQVAQKSLHLHQVGQLIQEDICQECTELKELALVEAIKVVLVLAFGAEQEVEEGKPHLPIEFSHLQLVFRGHHVPRAVLKLLELACFTAAPRAVLHQLDKEAGQVVGVQHPCQCTEGQTAHLVSDESQHGQCF